VGAAEVARLVALAAIWSASFVFIRVLVPPLGPVWMAALRLLLAGTVLVLWLVATRHNASLGRHWRAYLFVGLVNSALPFVLYGYAARELPASHMAILNCATPLFGAMLAAAFLDERLTVAKVGGIACGVAGVALVSRAGGLVVDGGVLLAIAASLAATFCYASAGVWLRRCGGTLSPYATAAWSQLFAGVALLPLGATSPPPGPIDAAVIANLLALALVCSAVAYILYYRLIRDVGPTRAMTVTLLMPAFGMAWGALFLGEAITGPMLAGAALIVAGTALVALVGASPSGRRTEARLEERV
jgi:drug/metabolite transporter (DMT)-like permease